MLNITFFLHCSSVFLLHALGGMAIAHRITMNSHLDIGSADWAAKAITLPEQGSAHTPAGSFRQYLDSNSDEWLPEKLTPDAIRTLAASLISALDRASMYAMFFDVNDGQENSPSNLLSTDFFMAMRNSATAAVLPVQNMPTHPSARIAPPNESVADMKAGIQKSEEVASPGVAEGKYASMIASAAASHGLDPKLVEAVIQTESGFNADAVSPVGAQGLMQLMPGTAADLGVSDAFDPEQNIQAGSKYLKQLMDRYDGDTGLALAAYNWGMGNLERRPEAMPQETVNYVAKITGLMNKAV